MHRYGVSDDLIASLDPIPVIRVPYTLDSANATDVNGSGLNWTTGCAELACNEYRVSSQNDREQLDR
jgi:hypothetical protein